MDDITSSAITSADTANVQAGGQSYLDPATYGDFLLKGVPAAAVSAYASVYNTGVSAANYFGADAEKMDVTKTLSDVDANWGKYYQDHQGIIDTAGFVAGSFLPGSLAVKGLNLLRRGEAAGALGRVLNFTTDMQTANLEKALQTIASPEGSLYTKLNSNYLQAIAWGSADSVLQTAAFEIGVAATMNASPLLDGASAKDLAHDIVKNALFGGLVGGGVEALFMNGITKRAISTVDIRGHKYDSLAGVQGLGLSADSDRVYAIIGAVEKLPKIVATEDASLPFNYSISGQERTVGLNTGTLYKQKLQDTLNKAWLDVEKLVTNNIATDGDVTVGKPLAKVLLDIQKQGKANALSDEQISSRMQDYLLNLKSAEAVGDKAFGAEADVTGETLHFFDRNAGVKFPFTPVSDVTSTTRGVAPDNSTMFRIKGDYSSLKVATLGIDAPSAKAAWDQGFDLAMSPKGGWYLNPSSSQIRRTQEPSGYQTILNTKSGEITQTASLTAADVATSTVPIKVGTDGTVVSGARNWKFSIEDGFADELGHDTVDMTARHAWAESLKKIDGTVSGNDISVLDRMSANPSSVADTASIAVGEDVRNWRDFGNFQDFVFNNKVARLQSAFEGGEQNIQKLAYEFNTTPDWIQSLVASNFKTNLKKLADNAPDLSTGWQRPLKDYSDRENLILTYQKPNPAMYADVEGIPITGDHFSPALGNNGGGFVSADGTQFITGNLAYNYRVKLAQDNADMAFGAVLGADEAAKFIPFSVEAISDFASRNPTGAGLLSFSNASYGDKLRLFSQWTGKLVQELTTKISNTNLSRLQPFFQMFKDDPKAAAELTAIVTKLRTSPQKFQLLGADYGLDGMYLIDKSLLRGAQPDQLAAIKDALLTQTQDGQKAFHIESDLVGQFLQTHQDIASDLLQKRSTLAVARGQTSNRDPGNLYVPPVDTTKVPYFAFVRPIEGKVFSDSNVSMLTAKSSAELQEKAAYLEGQGLQVIYKDQSEAYHKAVGDYQYSRSLNESTVDSSLRSEGLLGNFLPSFNVEATLEDFLNWHQRQAAQLVRDGVSTKYAQTFAELNQLGESFTNAARSKFEPLNKLFNRTVANPYDDVIKETLNLSKRSEFTILDQTNEILDALGTRAYRVAEDLFKKSAAGTVSWEDANNTMRKYGLGGVFDNQDAFNMANVPADRNLLKVAMQKANMVLTNFTLRLDAAHAIVHTISAPIMMGMELSSIRNSIKNDPAMVGALQNLTTVAVPGTGGNLAMPSNLRLISNAIKNWWGDGSAALIERYQKMGLVDSMPAEYHTMVDGLSLIPGQASKFSEAAGKAVEFGAKWTGNSFAESFNRFIAADVMRQLTEPLVKAGHMLEQEQGAFMNAFVNRVQGNYLASQRPILFQGTLGSALGLFQTYHLNMVQQIFRHVEDKNWAALAVGGALQTSIFGLDGLPLFNGINTNLLGNSALNTGHHDAYSSVVQVAGKEAGDWLMYGSASAFPMFGGQGPALYSRGQIAPRNLTVIPTTPSEIPAVDGATKFVTNLFNTGEKLVNGGSLGASLLQGLEHNSLSRPLAGVAQIMQGFSTTNKGQLIAATQDLFGIGNASRLLGAKPLDEAVGLNTKYRLKSYEAEDKDRVEKLGEAVKTTLVGNRAPSDEQMSDFMGKYMAAGGNINTFGRKIQEWSKEANTSVLNELSDRMKTPYGQRFTEAMGGTVLPDFTNTTVPPTPVIQPQ